MNVGEEKNVSIPKYFSLSLSLWLSFNIPLHFSVEMRHSLTHSFSCFYREYLSFLKYTTIGILIVNYCVALRWNYSQIMQVSVTPLCSAQGKWAKTMDLFHSTKWINEWMRREGEKIKKWIQVKYIFITIMSVSQYSTNAYKWKQCVAESVEHPNENARKKW